MQKIILLLAAAVLIGLPVVASADTVTFQAPATGANQGLGGSRQFDLDHHKAYAWRIGGVDLRGKSITSATLTFRNIRNWDSNPNMLFIHLLDSTRAAGVSSFQDATGTPVTDIHDNFAGSRYLSNPLVSPGTANTFLAQQSFTTTGRDFVYTFTADQLRVLSTYFLNGGDIGFGFDPDCHFWNDGIAFTFNTTPDAVPEPTTMLLLGSGLAGLYYRRKRQQRKLREIS